MIYSFNANPIKIPVAYFFKNRKTKSYNSYGIVKTVLKKSKVGGLTFLNLKTRDRATVIKTVWYGHKDRNIDQQSKIESSEINPCIYDQVISNKDAKTTQWGKNSK